MSTEKSEEDWAGKACTLSPLILPSVFLPLVLELGELGFPGSGKLASCQEREWKKVVAVAEAVIGLSSPTIRNEFLKDKECLFDVSNHVFSGVTPPTPHMHTHVHTQHTQLLAYKRRLEIDT